MNLINFRITFGDDKTTLIPDGALNNFYLEVARFILKSQNIEIKGPYHLNTPTKDSIKGNFNSNLPLVKKIIEENENKENCYLIHIEKPTKGTTTLTLLLYFKELILEEENNKLIFLSNDFEEILSINSPINDLIEQENKLFLVDRKGNYTINLEDRGKISDYSEKLQTIKLTKEDKLQFKLIRHIGHYQKHKDDKLISCQKYLYDGNECKDEIIELLYKKIIDEIDLKKTFAIQYNLPYSRWAESCFLSIDQRFTNNYSNEYKGYINNEKPKECEQIILIADVINSGKTFRNTYKELITIYPKALIKSFCIIETYTNTHEDKVGDKIEIDLSQGEKAEVYCLLRRQQVTSLTHGGSCEMCQENLNITPLDFNENKNPGRLSSFQMWSMIFESGITDEIIKVKREPSEGFDKKIPNTLDIVKKNGVILATKFVDSRKENSISYT